VRPTLNVNVQRYRDDRRFQHLLTKLGCTEEYRVARETLNVQLNLNSA
jgi:hypothetical protein